MSLDQTPNVSRWPLAVAILIANIFVWRGVYLEGDRFPKETQDRGWRILLCALAAEAALGFCLFSVDTAIGVRQVGKIAELNVEAEQLSADAAADKAQITIANAEAEHARSDAAKANARTAAITRENLELERAIAPRTLVDQGELVRAVSGLPRVPLFFCGWIGTSLETLPQT